MDTPQESAPTISAEIPKDIAMAMDIEKVRRIHGFTVPSLAYRLAKEVERLSLNLFLARAEALQNRDAARIGAEAIEREPERVKRAFVHGTIKALETLQAPAHLDEDNFVRLCDEAEAEAERCIAEGTL